MPYISTFIPEVLRTQPPHYAEVQDSTCGEPARKGHLAFWPSAQLEYQLKAVLSLQTCEWSEPADGSSPSCQVTSSNWVSQMRPEMLWSRDLPLPTSNPQNLGAKQIGCFTALHLGVVYYAAIEGETASESPRSMSTSCPQTALWSGTSYCLPCILISIICKQEMKSTPISWNGFENARKLCFSGT